MKKIFLGLLMLTLVGGMATAGLLTYYGIIEREVTVNGAVHFHGEASAPSTIAVGESVVSNLLSIHSETSVNVPVDIITTTWYGGVIDEEGITNTELYILDTKSSSTTGETSTVFITAEDVGITTLSDLDTISWDADVTKGYIAHVDVITESDALVFEYAKIDPTDCDDSVDYPTGEVNTFGDKGIVDDNSYAWLSSGPAGPCGDVIFGAGHNSLADWKTTNGSDNVIGFEIEVDNWVQDSTTIVANILINGNPVEVTIKPNDELDFVILTEFVPEINPGDYTIITQIAPR